MMPSRSAQGQTCSPSTSSSSITAWATSAPASSWRARPGETPGSPARSAALVRASRGTHAARSSRRSTRVTYGPSLLGAAPATRASERIVLLDPTTRSGAPPRASPRTALATSTRTSLRSAFTSPSRGGSCARCSRVSRPAPSGRLSATSGSSSAPTASSSDPPPMSTTSNRPADQPNQRRTARKVSRASASPVSTCRSTPVSARTRSSTSWPLGASRTAEVANGEDVLAAGVLGHAQRLADEPHQPVGAGRTDGAVVAQVLGQPQLLLVRGGGPRPRAGVGVDDEQVHRVRTDVEHAQPHAATLPRRLRHVPVVSRSSVVVAAGGRGSGTPLACGT